MAEQVRASDLVEGMVFADRPTKLNPRPELRVVTGRRTVRYLETRVVVEHRGIDSGLRGEAYLGPSDHTMPVVEPIAPRDWRDAVRLLEAGERITFYRTADGTVYA